jgi:rubredoxin
VGQFMFVDITCSTCGENSRILAADKHKILRCAGCGRSFERDCSSYDQTRCDDLAIDDEVIGWIVRSPGEPPTESADVDTCFSCGYEGSMPYDSERGIAICPACGAVRRDVPEEIPVVVDCPQCGQPIDVFERDRGKTTVCPHCKYFLGCVLQSAKRRFGERRFLGFRLSQRENRA